MAKILVVDDEPDVVELVRTILEAEGHAVVTTTEGKRALGLMLTDPPDLVVLDLMMPELDGFQILKLIRMDPRTSEVPVLILSARSQAQDQIGGLQLKASAYVCKPFSPKDLLGEVKSLLGGVKEAADV